MELIASTITDYVANGSFASLKANTTTYKEKNYALFVRTVDFANDFKKDLVYIDKTTYDFLEKSKLYGNELMLSNIGASIGKVFKIPMFDIPMSLAPNSIILRFFDGIFTDFFEYMFKSFVGQDYLQMLSGGSAMPKFNKTDLRVMIVPVAPSNEQIKIVEKINSIFSLVEKIDDSHTDISGLIQSAKSKILDLAIQGKLVPQNQDDEPASVLLERIKAEKEELIKQGKIKRDKKESIIFKGDDNSYYRSTCGENELCADLPFELPSGWAWCNLSMISQIITKGTTPRGGNVAYVDNGIGFLRAENVSGFGKLDIKDLKYVTEDAHNNFLKRSILCANDILVTIAGTLGRTAIVPEDKLPLNTNQAVSIVRPINPKLLNLMYIIYAINSIEVSKKLLSQSVEMAIPNLSLENISNCTFPLPPLEEQKRIVDAIETAFEQLDNILNSI